MCKGPVVMGVRVWRTRGTRPEGLEAERAEMGDRADCDRLGEGN